MSNDGSSAKRFSPLASSLLILLFTFTEMADDGADQMEVSEAGPRFVVKKWYASSQKQARSPPL